MFLRSYLKGRELKMMLKEYKQTLLSDLRSYNPNPDRFISCLLRNPGFQYSTLLRTAELFAERKGSVSWMALLLVQLILRCYEKSYKMQFSYETRIGPGLCIAQLSGIRVSPGVRIGKNCNMNHDVIIGMNYQGKYPGKPTIKDDVNIEHNAVIVGGIEVGNKVSIRPNSVVRETVPDNTIVMPLPEFLTKIS